MKNKSSTLNMTPQDLGGWGGGGQYLQWPTQRGPAKKRYHFHRPPNDGFLLNAMKTLFRLSRVLLDL